MGLCTKLEICNPCSIDNVLLAMHVLRSCSSCQQLIIYVILYDIILLLVDCDFIIYCIMSFFCLMSPLLIYVLFLLKLILPLFLASAVCITLGSDSRLLVPSMAVQAWIVQAQSHTSEIWMFHKNAFSIVGFFFFPTYEAISSCEYQFWLLDCLCTDRFETVFAWRTRLFSML